MSGGLPMARMSAEEAHDMAVVSARAHLDGMVAAGQEPSLPAVWWAGQRTSWEWPASVWARGVRERLVAGPYL